MSTAKIRNEKELVSVAQKKPHMYADVSLAALTIYSLYWLHQWELRRTIEAISVLNWKLFPDKFSMLGFPEYPDAFRVNRSLLQCQPKYRNWLTGAAKHGFNLNEQGLQIAWELIAKLGPPETVAGTQLGVAPVSQPSHGQSKVARTLVPEKYVQDVRATTLFAKWKAGTMTERDLIHVHSLLHIFDHTPIKVREQNMKMIERSAREVHDLEVNEFLTSVRKAFPSVFHHRS